jgi:hypothetical protein
MAADLGTHEHVWLGPHSSGAVHALLHWFIPPQPSDVSPEHISPQLSVGVQPELLELELELLELELLGASARASRPASFGPPVELLVPLLLVAPLELPLELPVAPLLVLTTPEEEVVLGAPDDAPWSVDALPGKLIPQPMTKLVASAPTMATRLRSRLIPLW